MSGRRHKSSGDGGSPKRHPSSRAFDMNQLQKSVEMVEKQASSRSSRHTQQHNDSIEVVSQGGQVGNGSHLPTAHSGGTENGQTGHAKKEKVRNMWGRISKQGMMAQAAQAASATSQQAAVQQSESGGGGHQQRPSSTKGNPGICAPLQTCEQHLRSST